MTELEQLLMTQIEELQKEMKKYLDEHEKSIRNLTEQVQSLQAQLNRWKESIEL